MVQFSCDDCTFSVWFGVVVTAFVTSVKFSYFEPS